MTVDLDLTREMIISVRALTAKAK